MKRLKRLAVVTLATVALVTTFGTPSQAAVEVAGPTDGNYAIVIYPYQGGDVHVKLWVNLNYNGPAPSVANGWFRFANENTGSTVTRIDVLRVKLWRCSQNNDLSNCQGDWVNVETSNPGIQSVSQPGSYQVSSGGTLWCPPLPTLFYHVEAAYQLYRDPNQGGAGWTTVFDENSNDVKIRQCY